MATVIILADADAQGLTKVLFVRMVGINLTEGRAEEPHVFTPACLRVPRSAKGIVILSTGKKILVR